MEFDYFYNRGTEQFAFYQVPKILITDDRFSGMSIDSKLLYSLMLDRSTLSAKNGWIDDKGRVYIYYTLDQIMADMHCANQKATKLLKELETRAGLIERQVQGQGKPTKIYVKDFTSGLNDEGDREAHKMIYEITNSEAHDFHDSLTHENHEPRDVKITSLESWKSCTNNTDINKTELSKTNLINLSPVSTTSKAKMERIKDKDDSMKIRKQYLVHLKEKLDVDNILQSRPHYIGLINELLDLMVDVHFSTSKTIRIAGEEKPADVVKAQFEKIELDHLEYILECLKDTTHGIKKPVEYLRTTIYNAPLTISHYYLAMVNRDMAHRKPANKKSRGN